MATPHSRTPVRPVQDRRSQLAFWLLLLGLSSLLFAQLQDLLAGQRVLKAILNAISLAWAGYCVGRATLLLLARDTEVVYLQTAPPEATTTQAATPAALPSAQTRPTPSALAATIPSNAPWASVFASLRPIKTHPLPLLLSQKDHVKSASDVKEFPLLQHRFKAPVEKVLEAVQRKYLALPSLHQQQVLGKRPQKGIKDTYNPWVSEASWLPADEIGGGSKIYRRKVVFDLSFIPALARRAAGVPSQMNLSEAFEWDPSRRMFFGHVENKDGKNIACFQEVSVFTAHPDNPQGETLYQSWMEIAAIGWAGKKAMELIPARPERILEKHITCLEERLSEVVRESS
jgi:hypothetical protein